MKKPIFLVLAGAGLVSLLLASACGPASRGASDPIVGAWFVKAPEAPFPYHMFVFSADGTLQQANPDAGDPNTSDIEVEGDAFRGTASTRFYDAGETLLRGPLPASLEGQRVRFD